MPWKQIRRSGALTAGAATAPSMHSAVDRKTAAVGQIEGQALRSVEERGLTVLALREADLARIRVQVAAQEGSQEGAAGDVAMPITQKTKALCPDQLVRCEEALGVLDRIERHVQVGRPDVNL